MIIEPDHARIGHKWAEVLEQYLEALENPQENCHHVAIVHMLQLLQTDPDQLHPDLNLSVLVLALEHLAIQHLQ